MNRKSIVCYWGCCWFCWVELLPRIVAWNESPCTITLLVGSLFRSVQNNRRNTIHIRQRAQAGILRTTSARSAGEQEVERKFMIAHTTWKIWLANRWHRNSNIVDKFLPLPLRVGALNSRTRGNSGNKSTHCCSWPLSGGRFSTHQYWLWFGRHKF